MCTKTIHRWFFVGAVVMCVAVPTGAQSPSDEYRLKAAFVYRFPQFVEWPAAAVRDARTLDVCVLEPNPFGSDLEQLVNGESLGGRPLRVRVVTATDDLTGCQALFVSANTAASTEILKAVASLPVLTVGETDDFLDHGGIIALKIAERRVRFEVDAANARTAGLRISAQLLNLASAVRGGLR